MQGLKLIEVTGANLQRQAGNSWFFKCESHLQSVATARYGDENLETQVSLPVSWDGGFPGNTCAVTVELTRSGLRANAWIAAERTVANGLQNMLSAGYVLQAAGIAETAVELLRSKYSDPTGAALGGLILQKVGRIGQWIEWVENLARDFEWLPDGKNLIGQSSLYQPKQQRPCARTGFASEQSNDPLYGKLLIVARSIATLAGRPGKAIRRHGSPGVTGALCRLGVAMFQQKDW